MQDLILEAARWGVNVTYRDLGRRHGEYRHKQRLITINGRLSHRLQRCVLAHELGHASHCDDAAIGHMTPAQEHRATVWAANRLISPVEYALAETLAGPHPGGIAIELGITRELVLAWRENQRATRATNGRAS